MEIQKRSLRRHIAWSKNPQEEYIWTCSRCSWNLLMLPVTSSIVVALDTYAFHVCKETPRPVVAGALLAADCERDEDYSPTTDLAWF